MLLYAFLYALVLACASFTPSLAQTHILGEWQIMEARNTAGQNYFGTVAINPLGVSAYSLDWRTSAGTYSGIGLMQGKKLCVGWGTPEAAFGVVVYKIESDKLIGAWTATGQDGKVGIEVASRVRAGIDNERYIEGRYDVIGENPVMQSAYEGTISITRNNDAEMYNLRWNFGNIFYNGVGIREGNYLYVGWGMSEAFGVIMYDLAKDNYGQGVWALPKVNTTGVENIRKK